jgi:hypothetical protein
MKFGSRQRKGRKCPSYPLRWKKFSGESWEKIQGKHKQNDGRLIVPSVISHAAVSVATGITFVPRDVPDQTN